MGNCAWPLPSSATPLAQEPYLQSQCDCCSYRLDPENPVRILNLRCPGGHTELAVLPVIHSCQCSACQGASGRGSGGRGRASAGRGGRGRGAWSGQASPDRSLAGRQPAAPRQTPHSESFPSAPLPSPAFSLIFFSSHA